MERSLCSVVAVLCMCGRLKEVCVRVGLGAIFIERQ